MDSNLDLHQRHLSSVYDVKTSGVNKKSSPRAEEWKYYYAVQLVVRVYFPAISAEVIMNKHHIHEIACMLFSHI